MPFTIYLPTAFPDGLGEAWWLALEEMIARENRISLVIDRKERHFSPAARRKNIRPTNFSRAGCARCRRRICHSPSTISASAIRSILRRLSRGASMDWDDLARLAADPNGDDRQRHGELSGAVEPERRRRAARDRDGQGGGGSRLPPRRQAFRLSVRRSRRLSPRSTCRWRRRRVSPARHPRCPASSRPKGYTNLHALPRVAWDGRQRSLRMMRVILSGALSCRR